MSGECEHDIDIDTAMTRLRCVKCGLDANVIEINKLTKELETTKKLLDEAVKWIHPDHDNYTTKQAEEWLKQYEEMRGKNEPTI